MMAIADNPQLDKETLLVLRQKILANQATVDDYKQIDAFLASYEIRGYISRRLQENGVSNFEELIRQRNSTDRTIKRRADVELVGIVLGALDALESFLQ